MVPLRMTLSDLTKYSMTRRHEASRGLSATAELLVMLPPVQTGRRHNVFFIPTVRLFVRYHTCEQDIFENARTDFAANRPKCQGWNDQLWGQEVKGRGPTTQKLDLKAWRSSFLTPSVE